VKLPTPEPGLVIRYSFLFSDDTEKDRPAVIVLTALNDAGKKIVIVLPITHTPPAKGAETDSLELPPAIKRHLNLDDGRSWIRLTEANRFEWPGFDLREVGVGKAAYGFLPPRFFDQVKTAFLATDQDRRVWMQRRDET